MKSLSAMRIAAYPRKFLAFLIICLLVASISIAVPARQVAVADQRCAGTWSNLAWSENSGSVKNGIYNGPGDFATLTFDWKFPNSSKQGDAVIFTLPDQLQTASSHDFDLLDTGGKRVAVGKWDGKKLIIQLTEFANERFDVQGSATISVRWDRQGFNPEHGFEGNLAFSGCGNDSLRGKYEAEVPGGILHETGKTGAYRDPIPVMSGDGNTYRNIYPIDWAVYISNMTKGSGDYGAFTVEDTAPEGYQFACDAKYNNGLFPFELRYRSEWGERVGELLDSSGTQRTGEYHGFIPAKEDRGNGFTVTCSEKTLSVHFPYGIDRRIAPYLTFRTFTTEKPEPLSTVKNTVLVDGKTYTGEVRIPGSSGFGTGKLGGFTIQKIITGDISKAKESYEFSYKCTREGGEKGKEISGNLVVKADGSHEHVSGLEKGMNCSVSEKGFNPDDTSSHRLTWSVHGTDRGTAEFETKSPEENAIDLIATNTYPEDPKEETGSFIIEKQLVGDPAIVDGLKDKEFNFTYSCNDEASQKVKASVNKPFTSEKEYPVGTKCVIKELEEGTDVEQHIWSHTLTPNDGVITIGKEQTAKVVATNIYTPVPKGTFTVKKVVEGDAKVATDPQYQSKEFSGEYKCGSSEWTPFKVSAEKPFISPEFLENTECEVKELDADAAISGYEWTSSVENGKFTIGKDKKQSIDVKFINTYKPKLGGFFLEKIVNGPAAGLAKDLEYSFNYVCGEKTGPLTVKAGEIIRGPIDIPVGTRCKVTEASFDSPRGTTWTGSITKNGEFTIEEDKTVQITATNTFDYSDGGFAISKTVGGDAKDLAKLAELPFEFKYSCKAPTGGNAIDGSVSVMNGQTKHIEKIPVGSECEVTESDIRHDGVDWSVTLSGEDISVNGATAKFKVPSEDAPALLVKAHNTFTQQKGSFKINKIVDAEAGVAVPKEFGFAWTCGNLSGEATVPVVNGRGSVAVSEEIAIGTECVISEKDASIPGASLATTWENQRFVIGEKDQVVSVTATNTYKAHTGGFVIRKQLVGAASDKAKEKVFTFDYVCTKRDKETARGILNIKGEGSSDPVSDIADGSECTITERDAHIDGTNWNHTISNDGKISIIGGNPTITVSAVNGYEKPPLSPLVPLIPLIPLIPLLPFVITPIIPPTSSVPPQIAPQAPAPQQPNKAQVNKQRTPLAKTGASVIGLGFASALLIAAGVFIIRRGKKKN